MHVDEVHDNSNGQKYQYNQLDLSPRDNINPSYTTDALIASVSLPVIVLTTVFACLTFIKRMFGRKARNTVHCTRISILSTSESIPDKTSYMMDLQDFCSQYEKISSDSFYRLSVEFDELKMTHIPDCKEGDKGINRIKNRFVNVLPYDHTRVSLKTDEDSPPGSDYINANYISGFQGVKEYIATQGPLKNTVNSFWEMCWQEGTKTIVMLTPCIDKEREKCYRYWPTSSKPEMYGKIEVEIRDMTMESYDVSQQWIITELILRCGDEERQVSHIQYITWPDFGAVEPPEALIHFVDSVRKRDPYFMKNPSGRRPEPIIVHCSAGVGRSGTFIAVDILMQQINTWKKIDIFGCVQNLRRDRVWMVQTEQQYASIYKCANAYLRIQGITVDSEKFPSPRGVGNRRFGDIMTKEELEEHYDISLDYEVQMIKESRLDAIADIAKLNFQ